MAAARVQSLVSKARGALEPTLGMASREAVKQYEQLMARNQQYVVKDPEAASKLLRQYVFTQLARIPAGVVHCKEEAAVLRHKWTHLRELNTMEVAQYVGFSAEVYAWFVIGEIIGRGGSLTGYAI